MVNNPNQQSISTARLFWYYTLTLVSLVFLTSGTSFEQWTWRIDRWVQTLTPRALAFYDILGYLLPVLVVVGYLCFLMPRIARVIFLPRLRKRFFVIYLLLLYVGYAVAYGLGVLGIVGWGQVTYAMNDTVASWYSFLHILGFLVLLPITIIALGMRWLKRTRPKKVEDVDVIST